MQCRAVFPTSEKRKSRNTKEPLKFRTAHLVHVINPRESKTPPQSHRPLHTHRRAKPNLKTRTRIEPHNSTSLHFSINPPRDYTQKPTKQEARSKKQKSKFVTNHSDLFIKHAISEVTLFVHFKFELLFYFLLLGLVLFELNWFKLGIFVLQ